MRPAKVQSVKISTTQLYRRFLLGVVATAQASLCHYQIKTVKIQTTRKYWHYRYFWSVDLFYPIQLAGNKHHVSCVCSPVRFLSCVDSCHCVALNCTHQKQKHCQFSQMAHPHPDTADITSIVTSKHQDKDCACSRVAPWFTATRLEVEEAVRVGPSSTKHNGRIYILGRMSAGLLYWSHSLEAQQSVLEVFEQ